MNLNVLNNTIAPQHVQNYSWSFAKASVATNDLHLGKVKKTIQRTTAEAPQQCGENANKDYEHQWQTIEFATLHWQAAKSVWTLAVWPQAIDQER